MGKALVTVSGILSIVFVYWFFLGKKEKAVTVKDSIEIIVDGGYTPSVIKVSVGKTTILNFLRKDSNSCLEELIIPEFHIKKFLAMNKKISVEINPTAQGEYEFHCGMNMFRGKVIAI